jgi:hypothetical protein
MPIQLNTVPAIALALVVALGAGSAAVGANQANTAGPLQCSIEASSHNSTVAIEGVVHSSVAVSGSYSLEVISSGPSGSSNVRQGGVFEAGPGGKTTLGRVNLGSPGATYDVSLSISANGTDLECDDRIAAR